MRVALIDPSLFTLPYDAALARGLAAAGADVSLWGRPLRPGESLDRCGFSFHPAFFRASEQAPSRVRPAAKALAAVQAWRTVWPQLEAWRPDVIHLQWLTAPLLDRARIDRMRAIAPVAITVHDSRPFHGAAPALQRAGWFAALAAADRLFVHHHVTRVALEAHGLSGFTHSEHGPLPSKRVGEPEPGLLVQFGAIKPYKGHDTAIEAMVHLPHHRLLIVGPPSTDPAPLLRLVQRLGLADRVAFDLRFVPDAELDAVLSRADVFLLPYRESDASGVLWRVADLARPVVASAVGGLAEDLVDGGTGVLVPPGDPAALADGVRRADGALGRALARHGRDWAHIGRRALAAYGTLQQPAT